MVGCAECEQLCERLRAFIEYHKRLPESQRLHADMARAIAEIQRIRRQFLDHEAAHFGQPRRSAGPLA
jgi:hypothetical protein